MTKDNQPRGMPGRFQEHIQLKRTRSETIKNWNRSVIVDATDTGYILTMMIKDLASMRSTRAHPDEDYPIHLQASQETLIRVFWVITIRPCFD